MLISQENHCIIAILDTGNTGIQTLKTVCELYSRTQKMQQVCQDTVLCFEQSCIKPPPVRESLLPKKSEFQSTISKLYNITERLFLGRTALLYSENDLQT